MRIKLRDWSVLLLGVMLILLGSFQIAYDIKRYQVQDFVVGAIFLVVYLWLFYVYKYKNDKELFDEYYISEIYKLLQYMLVSIILLTMVIILIFEKDSMISVNYIYGAIRLAVGFSALYFSYTIMKKSDYE